MCFGCFLFAMSFAKDWKGDLQILDEMVKTKQPKVGIMEKVVEFTRTHSNVKQLSSIDRFEETADFFYF